MPEEQQELFDPQYYLYSITGQGFMSQGRVWSRDATRAIQYTLDQALDLASRSFTATGELDRFPVAVDHVERLLNADR